MGASCSGGGTSGCSGTPGFFKTGPETARPPSKKDLAPGATGVGAGRMAVNTVAWQLGSHSVSSMCLLSPVTVNVALRDSPALGGDKSSF